MIRILNDRVSEGKMWTGIRGKLLIGASIIISVSVIVFAIYLGIS